MDEDNEISLPVEPSEKTLDYFFDENTWDSFKKPLKDFDETDMKSLEFHSLEACEEFYSIYAKIKGFGIRKRSPRYSTVDGHPTSCPFVCEAQGCRDAKWDNLEGRKKIPKKITRFNCEAKMRVKFIRGDNIWKVYHFIGEHSHPLVHPKHVPYIRYD